MNNSTISSKREPVPAYFLNRIALEYESDPHKQRLLSVLKDFFSFASPQEHLDMIDRLCIAAMHQKYSWKGGSPGNALFYGERLELLIEAAYLLNAHGAGKQRKKTKQAKIHPLSANEFPMYLTSIEYLHPFLFVESFFTYAALQRWKKILNVFITSALSNSSVTDELAPQELLPFVDHLKKLVCAAYRIQLITKKNI